MRHIGLNWKIARMLAGMSGVERNQFLKFVEYDHHAALATARDLLRQLK